MARIVSHLRHIRPHVVITFDPNGAYGHPDHIAICQLTTAAVLAAADPNYLNSASPHSVTKLYYMAWPQGKFNAYESVFGQLVMHVDHVARRTTAWPDWAVTTVIDTADYWPTVWKAVSCHRSQLSAYGQLEHLSVEHHKGLWGTQEYYRALSLVNGGRARETDLFEGLR
jgi:LmbE family N-acetylglucosaminyl deacetylase